jgi:phosphatidylinositol alpha 1,6-mannosyltransferase
LPTVAAAASGSRSLIADGETGFLIADARNVAAFASALVALADESALRARMSAASLKAAQIFDWDAILDGLLDDYRAAMIGN